MGLNFKHKMYRNRSGRMWFKHIDQAYN